MTLIELRQTLAALRQSGDVKNFEAYYGPDAAGKLTAFADTVEALLKPDTNGNMPVLDVAAQQNVFTAASRLQTAIASGKELKAFTDNEPDVFEADRGRITEIVQLFASLDATKNKTAVDALEENERITAAVSGEVKRMGGSSSSRNLINIRDANGNSTNGFFTDGNRYLNLDPDGTMRRVLEAAGEKNKDDAVYQQFVHAMLDPRRKYGPGILTAYAMGNEDGKKMTPRASESFAGRAFNWNAIIDKNYLKRDFAVGMMQNKNVQQLIKELYTAVDWKVRNDVGTLNAQYGNSSISIRAELNSSIPMRNVAMSRVAALLGKPELIARSVPVTVERDGVKMQGVFMEEAKGETFPDAKGTDKENRLEVQRSKFGHMKSNPFKPSAVKAMADIEIIDFICGNVDRHQSNLTYIFDSHNYIIGVQGIDNDLSFGTENPDIGDHIQNGTPLADINVISKEMADAVRNLSPETLKSALADTGLKPREIDAAVERLNTMKNHIEVSAEREKNNEYPADAFNAMANMAIHVMTEDEWKQDIIGNISVWTDKEFNILGNAQAVQQLRREAGRHHEPEVPKNLSFAPAEQIDELSPEKLAAADRTVSDLYTAMKNSVSRLHKCHDDFQKIIDCSVELLDFRKPRPDGTVADIVNNPAERTAYMRLLQKLAEAAEAYKGRKSFEIATRADTGRTGRNRCEMADKMMKFATGQLISFRDAILDNEEKKLNEAYKETAEARKMEEKLTIVADALVDRIMENGSTMEKDKVAVIVQRGVTLDTMVKDGAALDTLVTLAKENPQELFRRYVETNRAIQEGKNVSAALEAAEEKLAHTAPAKQPAAENKAPAVK